MILVPKPHKLETKEGKLEAREFKISVDNEAIKYFDTFGGGEFPLNVKKAEYNDAEKYNITIDAEGITVVYGDLAAAYRAYTTLTQILASEEVPYLTIEDYPDIPNRGSAYNRTEAVYRTWQGHNPYPAWFSACTFRYTNRREVLP